MKRPEVFNTATWNFISGDRSVEDILKDKRLSRITVRGGMGTVLPTLAGIKDISRLGWKDSVGATIHVPSNTLSLHSPYPETKCRENDFYETLLRESYGINIRTGYESYPDQLILVMNMTEESNVPGNVVMKILEVLKEARDAKTIFTSPAGETLLSEFRPYVRKSWSTIYWDGLNAFFSDKVEEAVMEANPGRILVLGYGREHVFYTAIGAVDYFIIEDGHFRDPSELKLWDIIELGKKVSVISYPCGGRGETKTLQDMVLNHIKDFLKAESVMPDYAYTQVADHKIMIDVC